MISAAQKEKLQALVMWHANRAFANRQRIAEMASCTTVADTMTLRHAQVCATAKRMNDAARHHDEQVELLCSIADLPVPDKGAVARNNFVTDREDKGLYGLALEDAIKTGGNPGEYIRHNIMAAGAAHYEPTDEGIGND